MKTLTEIAKDILNKPTHKNEYGCVMVYIEPNNEFKDIHRKIYKQDIYEDPEDPSYGLEREPHVTLLFGLHPEVTLEQVKGSLAGYEFDKPLKAYNVSCFSNDKYDVLKFDIEGEHLAEMNKALKKFPYTSNFPDYHPHSTIAYLKPRTGQKYIDMFKGLEIQFIPSHYVYSEASGEKTNISL